MEKQAVVKAGKSPSEFSGKQSCIVKNGKALAKDEEDTLTKQEELLALKMNALYNRAQT